jgi:hypothetical protein
MSEDNNLGETAREAIRTERLPDCMPDRSWGGKGAGAICQLCSASIKHEQLELEIEFDDERGRNPRNYRVHVPCFTAWSRELQRQRSARRGQRGSQAAAREWGFQPTTALP